MTSLVQEQQPCTLGSLPEDGHTCSDHLRHRPEQQVRVRPGARPPPPPPNISSSTVAAERAQLDQWGGGGGDWLLKGVYLKQPGDAHVTRRGLADPGQVQCV